MTQPRVAILMGSRSDWPAMREAADVLAELGVTTEAKVISAHRRPERLAEYIREAEARGVQLFIAGAGGAAHLPGVIASRTIRPVLGVPMATSLAGGLDSLLSIVQMPRGVPVACLATGPAGARNAGLLAAEILALADRALADRLVQWRQQQAESLPEAPE